MPLFRATLAYEGTDFQGWQRQARGRTVQGTLEQALARLDGDREVCAHGAGRTDAGVHALGQVASFELERSWDPGALRRALNSLLPHDLRALAVRPAPPGFHARRSALGKLYRYVLDTAEVQLPTRRRLAAHRPGLLDPERVRATAALFVGGRDFASLASSGTAVRTSVREVRRSEARFDGETLVYEVEADGFLRKMVRSMVGGLIAAGCGQRQPAALADALAARDRRQWPAPAAAHGLTLIRVDYAD
jgi:tRNA pseudouridine38-40 synthase